MGVTERVEFEGTSFSVEPGEQAAFWQSLTDGHWEPHTLRLLAGIVAPGDVVVDVGAWIGPTALFAAARGATVLAYEPDPVALGSLRRNLDANPSLRERIRVIGVALWTRNGSARLFPGRRGFGTSGSTLVTRDTDSCSVEARDVRDELRSAVELRECSVLKIDVEGAEFALGPRMAAFLRRRRPHLLVSVHGADARVRFPRAPTPLRRVLQRCAHTPQRLRLAWALRSYRRWYRAPRAGEATAARWTRVRGSEWLGLLGGLGGWELYLPRDGAELPASMPS